MARARAVQKKSLKGFYALLAVLGVVGAGTLVYLSTQPSAAPVTTVDASLLPPAEAEGYVYGKPDAPVNIMEWGDFSCGHCSNFTVIMEPEIRTKLLDAGLARLTYYDYPLNVTSTMAHNAAACAADQGKFWEMHDRLYFEQGNWISERNPKKLLMSYAKDLALNMKDWEECYDTQKHAARIAANLKEGNNRRVTGTPTFFIGDKMISGAWPYDTMKVYVAAAAAAAKTAPSPGTKAAATP